MTNETGTVFKYSGLVFDIINELAKKLNFTYTVTLFKGQHFMWNYTTSFPSSNSEISDTSTYFIPPPIVNMVKLKKVIMGACIFTVTEQSKTSVNFTTPVNVQSHTFLVSRPKELSRALLFMSPFTKIVS